MARPILDDELWRIVAPLLPKRRKRRTGRPPIEDRQALAGILFVLRTGIPWEYLPLELGFGSGMTCWRRLRDWQKAGVWDRLHRELLVRLNAADKIDWSRAVADSASVRAVFGGPRPGQTRPTGAKRGPSTTSSRMRLAFRSLLY